MRFLIRRCLFSVCVLSCALTASAQKALPAADTDRMNIIMIAVDDLNDWVGFMDGHPMAKTPHMDRLAAEAAVFTNAHCAAPACNPSRAAIMSGIAPHVSGMFKNSAVMRENEVLRDAVMLPRYLSQHGYTSMVRGKIFHHAGMDPQSWDIMSDQQSDRIHVPRDQQTDMSPYREIKVSNALYSRADGEGWLDLERSAGVQPKGNLFWQATNEPKETTTDYQNALWAAQWLNQSAEQSTPTPFFLACGIFRPHLPWVVPAEYFARFDREAITLPPINEDDLSDTGAGRPSDEYLYAVKHGLREEAVWAYLASIAYADDCIGVILDALDQSPYRNNTIVVLWGDHGWHLGEKLRYKKFTAWEESTRVPFIIKVPGYAPARSTRPVSLLDLYPTLLELAAVPAKAGLSGRSVVPLLRDPEAAWDEPALTSRGDQVPSLRDERWRYILNRNGLEELYDHDQDPHEWDNVSGDPSNAQTIEVMRRYLPPGSEEWLRD